jgi:hypothetical protein
MDRCHGTSFRQLRAYSSRVIYPKASKGFPHAEGGPRGRVSKHARLVHQRCLGLATVRPFEGLTLRRRYLRTNFSQCVPSFPHAEGATLRGRRLQRSSGQGARAEATWRKMSVPGDGIPHRRYLYRQPARLSGAEQKGPKTTAFDLQLNPSNPGSLSPARTAAARIFVGAQLETPWLIVHERPRTAVMLCRPP